MSEETDLIIRRVRALLDRIDKRTSEQQQSYKDYKDGKSKTYVSTNKVPVSDFWSEVFALKDALRKLEGDDENTSRIPYTVERIEQYGGGEIVERHESFGIAQFMRSSASGSNRLFGSHLEGHPTVYSLTIRRARRIHSDLAYDSYMDDHGRKDSEIVEIDMSPSQFTDLITNMNSGSGIPVTLRRVNWVSMEAVPKEHVSERERIREKFAEDMADVAETLKPLTDQIGKILAKKSIGKKDREEINSLIVRIVRKFTSSAAFTLKQFEESADKMETAGKQAVEAYAQSVIMAAGLEHLKELGSKHPDEAQRILDAMVVEAKAVSEGEDA